MTKLGVCVNVAVRKSVSLQRLDVIQLHPVRCVSSPARIDSHPPPRYRRGDHDSIDVAYGREHLLGRSLGRDYCADDDDPGIQRDVSS